MCAAHLFGYGRASVRPRPIVAVREQTRIGLDFGGIKAGGTRLILLSFHSQGTLGEKALTEDVSVFSVYLEVVVKARRLA